MKLLLVRHGESTWNAEGRYQGRMDPPLSERGLRQADALATYLASGIEAAPAAIVSSPLARALGTAEEVGRRVGIQPHIDERLIEISHGEWEGLRKREIEQRWPEMSAAWSSAPHSVAFPGGESLADVQRRWQEFLAHAARLASPLLIVTHDVIVRIAVLDAKREPMSSFNSFASENAAISELALTPQGLRLVKLNANTHLGVDRADPAKQAL